MTAACDVPSHSTLASEVPVLRGRAHALGCPGCSDEPCAGRFGCVWESHVKRAPRLANAALWHQELCSKLDEITDPQDRTNHVRVVCLLAMVTQACASEPLFEWLLANLRPMSDDCSHPLHQSTANFGARFARAIPPPPHGNDASDPKMWADRLSALLLRLQTNLFYIDSQTIGIFPIACQLQHSCRPNAAVVMVGTAQDAKLAVQSLQDIRRGERVAFCYLVDGPAGVPLADQVPLKRRRQLVLDQAGFVCRCEACEAQEAQEVQEARCAGIVQ